MSEYENKFVDVWGYLPRIRVAIKLGLNIGFRGATGTGKTFVISELAKEKNKRLWVLNMTAGTGVEEVKGRYVVQPDEDGKTQVKWVDGTLVTAMKNGDWLVIEEANFMPEELASLFYSVMDDRRNIILDEHENEVVKAHPDFRIFLTGNWGYRGTTIPNDAIRNRVNIWFDFVYLPENEEAKLIERDTKVDKKVAKLISKFAWKQRRIKSRHQPDISTRILKVWANLIHSGEMSPITAGEHTIVSLMSYEETEKDKIREALKFEFEELEGEYVSADGSAGVGTDIKAKTKEGTVGVGDLVSIDKGGMKLYGVVTKITHSKTGKKVWAIWNDDLDKAIKRIPSPTFPLEMPDLATRVMLEKSKEELK